MATLLRESGRDDDGYSALDVFDDVSISVDETAPPAAALARLPSCSSTLVLEYYGRVFDKAPFVALQKLLFERVGDALFSDGGTRLTTIEAAVAERARLVGPTWAKTPPLGSREGPKKPLKTRPAKPGELEAVAVHKRLARIIEGNDPFAREALKKELERTTDAVRNYAAELMDAGPRPDAAIAKELRCPAAELAKSREMLSAILKSIN